MSTLTHRMPFYSMPQSKSLLKKRLLIVGYIFVALLIIEVINIFTGRLLNQFSIVPRALYSLPFIFTAPLLHATLQHFLSNIATLCVFVFLVLQFGERKFVTLSLGLVIGTGLLVWLFGRNAFHLGASGVIYGYFGFLLLAGFLSKKLVLILISVLVAIFYGTMVWGVLPNQPYISWESHLFGFVSGLYLAWLLTKRRQ
ncbi:rhomboid-like protein [Glaciecola punicea ACAM 611]|uniref:Rhomboid-like protein n=1 Tax=Glaciecola punicea ACAM 611 TaxID=1121923 RepID=H5TCT7_9ALTE|nr:rhomboid-like protein [Glaciecola punicea ACAM 611]